MNGEMLKNARKRKGLTQVEAAEKLGVSQTYLSLFEKDRRPLSGRLARKAVNLFEMQVTALPLRRELRDVRPTRSELFVKELAALDYPGYSHLKSTLPKNPAEVLFSALASDDLDARSVEALPWILLKFPDLEWTALVEAAKLKDLQNRLGFLTTLALGLAEKARKIKESRQLKRRLAELEKSRLANEGFLCRNSMTEAERRWVRENRSADAVHWNILSDLKPDQLRYVP